MIAWDQHQVLRGHSYAVGMIRVKVMFMLGTTIPGACTQVDGMDLYLMGTREGNIATPKELRSTLKAICNSTVPTLKAVCIRSTVPGFTPHALPGLHGAG